MAGEHILIVDDEPAIQTALRGVLEDEGYRVTAVGQRRRRADGRRRRDARPRLPRHLDARHGRPGDAGRAQARCARRPPVVMISGHGTIETAVKATRLGAYDFIEKPLSLEKTLLTVTRALEHGRLERENAALRAQLDERTEIIGDSAVDAGAARADRHRRAQQRPRAHPRRERQRQGAGGPRHPRAVGAPRAALRGGQLRGHPRGADRVRAVRPRAGRVHRAPWRAGAASSSSPTAARCSSTRSAT